ncbi:MAG: hypothetical protein FWC27_06480 [Firmicutes bacterium]|nr:hypothetical protein [Bacillota bacterium]
MIIDIDNLVPIQLGFDAMEQKVKSKGYAVIVKDDKACYLMLDISNENAEREAIEHLQRIQRAF